MQQHLQSCLISEFKLTLGLVETKSEVMDFFIQMHLFRLICDVDQEFIDTIIHDWSSFRYFH